MYFTIVHDETGADGWQYKPLLETCNQLIYDLFKNELHCYYPTSKVIKVTHYLTLVR